MEKPGINKHQIACNYIMLSKLDILRIRRLGVRVPSGVHLQVHRKSPVIGAFFVLSIRTRAALECGKQSNLAGKMGKGCPPRQAGTGCPSHNCVSSSSGASTHYKSVTRKSKCCCPAKSAQFRKNSAFLATDPEITSACLIISQAVTNRESDPARAPDRFRRATRGCRAWIGISVRCRKGW